ncbi:MAG: acetyl-CoA carboxylase biotin carboxylase subunit [Thermoleophilia bacterium]
MFNKVLVANRGEIACRVIRACEALGIATVAVYSDADKDAPHVSMATEAHHIGPPPAPQSYLNQDRLFEVARAAKIDAVHPGYGFLAENFVFAERCLAEGYVFVGPGHESIRTMGDKAHARLVVGQAGVPLIPGSEASRDLHDGIGEMAAKLGYPVIVKAAAGGGGIGMHVISGPEQLEENLKRAHREAQAAFGDPLLYLERFIPEPRHVEFQVIADRDGKVVQLFERECSIQRRYQKVVEESPSPRLSPQTRARMGADAVKAAESVCYVNAGTVEFLMDADESYYFLEMNTRIQVEHAVTEMVTGRDLVQLQLKVAAGESLGFAQDEVTTTGAAIECRIYAEDPDRNFMPSPGKITALKLPTGDGVRVDAGVSAGYEVSYYYDPMIAKLITWGADRTQAISRMCDALDGFVVEGIATNIGLHKRIMADPAFADSETDTYYLQRLFANGTGRRSAQ